MISFGDNLKNALVQMWSSKEVSADKPKLHFDLNEKGHFQMEAEGKARVSMDLPGNLDYLAVQAANKAAELGNLAP